VKLYIKQKGKFWLLVMLALLCSNFTGTGQSSPSLERRLKAVFLFNFTQFVQWPQNALPADQSPFVIGILGPNPFGVYLEEIISDEKVNGHPLTVHYYNQVEEMQACHILFVNIADIKKQEETIAALKNRNILTVSDSYDFLQKNGMIRLYTSENKIKIQINLEASKNAGMEISSKLLRLAEIFTSDKKD